MTLLFILLVCPEGYYGDHCMFPCECPNDNFQCHPVQGCVCRHGLTGINCEEQLYASIKQNQSDSITSIVVGIFVSLLIIASLLGFLYYRRRVANLKTEIAHVQYIADQNGFSPGFFLHLFYLHSNCS